MESTIRKLSKGEWYSIWAGLPLPYRDVYSHPRYHEICAAWESCTPECLYWSKGEKYFLYSYLCHAVKGFSPEDRIIHDVQTPYGYGGPIFVGDWSAEEKIEILIDIRQYLKSKNVIAEFVRCNAERLENSDFVASGYQVMKVRNNVELTLKTASFEGILDSWHPTARQNAQRALKAGLTYEVAAKDRIGDFERLYEMTAERLGMDDFYWFDHDYFYSLLCIDDALTKLVLVSAPGIREPIAGGILFLGGLTAYWHLGASDVRYKSTQPNDLLLLAMAKIGFEAGLQKIVWGGGTSDDPADTLFKFKRYHGDNVVPVYIACRVTDSEVYESVCTQWEQRHPDKKTQNNRFLKYRD